MGGRSLLKIAEELAKGIKKGASKEDLRAAQKSIEKLVSPAQTIPRAGAQLQVRGMPSNKPLKSTLDPLGYSGVKMTRPIETYAPRTQATNIPLIPRKVVTLEDAQREGAGLLSLYGDRSAGEGLLEGAGDIALQRKYALEGGSDFKRGPAAQADRAAWASKKHIMTNIANAARDWSAANDGSPVWGVTVSMAPDALDFASFTSRVAADLMQQGISGSSAKKFDAYLRKQDKMGDWPGILSPDVDGWLYRASPDQRKTFMREADKKDVQKDFGLPPDVIGAARYAVTDPSQAGLLSGYGGHGISRLDLENPFVENPQFPHSTYDTQMRGDYLGGFPVPLRQEFLWQDAFRRYLSPDYVSTKGDVGALSPANATYALKTQLPIQKVTQQMVDEQMTQFELAKSLGLLD